MCDPVTLAIMAAATAATTVGTGMAAGNAAQDNARIAKARNDVLRDTNAKNAALSQRNREAFNSRIGDMAPEKTGAALDAAQQERAGSIEANIAPAAIEAPLDGDAPKVIGSNLAQTMASVFAKSKAQAQALGALGGYGDQSRDAAIADMGTRNEIGTNNSFVRGNAAIMPYLQDFAEARTKRTDSTLAQTLQALGQVGTMYAGATAGGFGKKAPVRSPPTATPTGSMSFGGPR